MNQTETLRAKGHLLDRPTRPTQKKKGIRRASPRRQEQLKLYWAKRRAFLSSHRFCQGKHFVGKCSENFVGQVVEGCFNKAVDLHHRAGRIGAKLLDEKDFVALCRKCHNRVHESPKEARSLGLLV